MTDIEEFTDEGLREELIKILREFENRNINIDFDEIKKHI